MAYEHLYEWVVVKSEKNMADLYALEKKLFSKNIKSRIINENQKWRLKVPLKDAEMVGAFIEDERVEIIDCCPSKYHAFDHNVVSLEEYINHRAPIYERYSRSGWLKRTNKLWVILTLALGGCYLFMRLL